MFRSVTPFGLNPKIFNDLAKDLQKDEQRYQRTLSEQKTLQRSLSQRSQQEGCDKSESSESDSDQEGTAFGKKKAYSPKHKGQLGANKLRRGFGRLVGLNTIVKKGVRNQHLAHHMFQSKTKIHTKEHEDFVGKILNYGPLMRYTTKILTESYTAACESDVSNMFGVLAKALGEVKKTTASTAWALQVRDLLEQVSDVTSRYNSMKEQFHEARSSYLKEVAELRDKARVRGDPIAALDVDLDVTWFFEPTQLVTPEERKFLLDLMREKFKMMAESNPKVVKTFDFGQMKDLVLQVESHETSQLKKALQKKSEEIKDLQKMLSAGPAPPSSNDSGTTSKPGKKEQLIDDLYNTLEQARISRDEHQRNLKKAEGRIAMFEVELGEMASSLEDEVSQRMLLQKENEHLLIKAAEEEEAKSKLEEQTISLTNTNETLRASLLKRDQQLNELKSTVASQERGLHNVTTKDKVYLPKAANADDLPQVEKSCDRIEAVEGNKKKQGRESFQDEDQDSRMQKRISLGDHAEGPRSVECLSSRRSLHQAPTPVDVEELPQDRALSPLARSSAELAELEQLRADNAKLQELVCKHFQEHSRHDAEIADEQAEDFCLLAENLGCMDSIEDKVPETARLCKCGNVLMEDCMFCRKCGQEWQAHSQTRPQMLANLSLKTEELHQEYEKAVHELHEELKKEDPLAADRVAQAERKVARIKGLHRATEQRLISERSALCLDESEPLTEAASCDCDCARELKTTKAMLKQLRVLCAEITVKLRETTGDNIQLNSTLDSQTVALQTAQVCMKRRSKSLENDGELKKVFTELKEAEHNGIFNRILKKTLKTKAQWEERRHKLMEESASVIVRICGTPGVTEKSQVDEHRASPQPDNHLISGEQPMTSSRPSSGKLDQQHAFPGKQPMINSRPSSGNLDPLANIPTMPASPRNHDTSGLANRNPHRKSSGPVRKVFRTTTTQPHEADLSLNVDSRSSVEMTHPTPCSGNNRQSRGASKGLAEGHEAPRTTKRHSSQPPNAKTGEASEWAQPKRNSAQPSMAPSTSTETEVSERHPRQSMSVERTSLPQMSSSGTNRNSRELSSRRTRELTPLSPRPASRESRAGLPPKTPMRGPKAFATNPN